MTRKSLQDFVHKSGKMYTVRAPMCDGNERRYKFLVQNSILDTDLTTTLIVWGNVSVWAVMFREA